jgi:hypothetical protein
MSKCGYWDVLFDVPALPSYRYAAGCPDILGPSWRMLGIFHWRSSGISQITLFESDSYRKLTFSAK